MAKLDLRVRLVGRALRRMSIATMDEERVGRLQGREIGHHPVIDFVNGGIARGTVLADGTAAGQTGPMPIRSYVPARHNTEPLPLMVHFHGGGWVLGSLEQGDWLCS
jgi:acetyl esterase